MIVLLFALALAACAPGGVNDQPGYPNDVSYPNDGTPSYPSPINLTPAQQAAVTVLSQSLNLPPELITVISTEAVEWPDGCLGIQRADVMCTQAIVPGYRIILQAKGVLYEVRTDENGGQAALAGDVLTGGDSVEEILAKQLAANLGLEANEISVFLSSGTEFSDACLGVEMKDVLCAQMIVPGRIVVLEADGVQYTYHVSNDGTRIQPATLALTWSREGGIAGFCDNLTVFLSGEIYGNQCKSQPGDTMGTFAVILSEEERAQLAEWMQEFGEVSIDASDPVGVMDRMEVKLEFYGKGSGTLTGADEQALIKWAQEVFQKLYN
jgi:hypothetical protein